MVTIKQNGAVKLKRLNGVYFVLRNGLNVFEGADYEAALSKYYFELTR